MPKRNLSKKELESLRAMLPDDYATKIAFAVGLSKRTIEKFFKGAKVRNYNRDLILSEAINLAELQRRNGEYLSQRVKKILRKIQIEVDRNERFSWSSSPMRQ